MKVVRDAVGPGVLINVVVKADAYGLGAARVARRLVQAGAAMLTVYSPSQAEALEGVSVPVLVLQPVLQYGEHGPGWQLQSWFVDANDHKYPVVTAPAITVEPGHQITSFMVQTDDGHNLGWTVSGTNINTGANSTLHIAYSKAGDVDYDYAMLVNENINVNTQCDRMPASTNVSFSKVSVNGESKPQWTTRANCAGNPQCDCGNAAAVDVDTGDVTLSWKYE